MTDVPTYEKKLLPITVARYGRGRELFRPPTYNSDFAATALGFEAFN